MEQEEILRQEAGRLSFLGESVNSISEQIAVANGFTNGLKSITKPLIAIGIKVVQTLLRQL